MVRENTLWAFVVVVLFAAIVLPGLNLAGNENTFIDSVENESVTIDFDTDSVVNPPHEPLAFEPNATAFNSSGVELVNGTDFEWHPSDGTISWFDTASTSDGEAATVSYEYEARTRDTREINQVLEAVGGVLVLLVLFGGVGAAFRYGMGW